MKTINKNVETKNGTVVGDYFIPDDVELREKRPVIVFSHGFSACTAWMMDTITALVDKGNVVYAFDYWGGGPESRSNKDMRLMSIKTEIDDLMAVIDAVKKEDWAETVYLMGESQGGLVSALTAVRRDDIPRLVMYYPAFVILDDAYNRFGENLENCPEEIPMWETLTISKKYYEDIWGMDFYKEASSYDKPVLIIHGTEDPVVPLKSSEKLCPMYKNARLITIEGAGHGYGGEDVIRAAGYASDFLRQS